MVACKSILPHYFSEDVLARLTVAAYAVLLRHGLYRPFIDVELELWREFRMALAPSLTPVADAEVVLCPL